VVRGRLKYRPGSAALQYDGLVFDSELDIVKHAVLRQCNDLVPNLLGYAEYVIF